MALTQEGYIKRTAAEIKADLINSLQQTIPEFTQQNADLQSDLIDTSIEALLQYEDMMNTLFNAYAPDYANADLFKKFAESIGLRQREAFQAQVTLTFSGKFGDFIPKGTIVTDVNGVVEFKTQDNIVLDTTGTGSVIALSDTEETWEASTIGTLKTIVGTGISVTNKVASLKYIAQETEAELKARAQAKFRSVRQGGKLYATSLLQGLEGVDRRLVAFYDKTITQEWEGNNYFIKGIEAVVGGGADEQVAKALYLSFLETQKLVSSPSSNEASTRTRDVTLYVYDNAVNVRFTRPKLLQLKLKMNIAFTSMISTPVALQQLTQSAVTNYINTLQVGISINKYSLIEIIMPILVDAGMPSYTMKSIDFTYALGVDGVYGGFNSDGFIKEVEFDCYVELIEYGVEING